MASGGVHKEMHRGKWVGESLGKKTYRACDPLLDGDDEIYEVMEYEKTTRRDV